MTKEFLDGLEGPRVLKPKNKRGRSRRSATMHEPRTLVKADTGFYSRPRAMTLDDEITLPKLMEVGKIEVQNTAQTGTVDRKVEHDRSRRNPTSRTCSSME